MRAFFDRYAAALLRLCRSLTGREEDAEDAVQEAFLRLQEHYPRLDLGRNPVGWLFRTAANAALRLRQRRAAPPAGRPAEAEAGPFLLDREADLAAIRLGIDRLPAEQRLLVDEWFRQDCSPAEIARRHDLPPGRVRVQLFRALESLRKIVKESP